MKKSLRRALIEQAGQLYTLERELALLRRQRGELDERIAKLERTLASSRGSVDRLLERATSGPGVAVEGEEAEQVLTPGKLPQRVLAMMKSDPARIHAAADLAAALEIADVQQVRTALARLVQKGLVRRAGSKGQFTL